ncbi:MAG: helix-turn-helix transcriptional regulator [Oligoflexia bacterium]|nr:helix-turn-helix transcriptional regulator [Oligoflexia bacterium]
MTWNKDSVRELRLKLKLTQIEFAQALGCRQQTISEWEQGIYVPANAYSKLLNQLNQQVEMSRPLLHQKRVEIKPEAKIFHGEEEPTLRAFDPTID